ncbi:phage tail protein [Pseudomonas sp. RTC3]|uniref:phage tail protein n=1 Tax=Pseudomonas sp. 5C2 TaxID=3048588 RepID=UPI002AB42DE4|nr:phage tail protein [Pseudomonas sp. 5C2]MDY7565775.1 phage tail protein [Pseudomonas sp. 5C2]MEB0062444.1 phage tail protein [Pseudomonas sp. RTC3]MEB0240449.1 phage tail protein [Pseudomonas sp. 5C2]
MSLPPEWTRPGLGLAPLEASWAVSSIVAEICQRAGIPPAKIDLAGLGGMCDGFSMTSEYGAFTGLENLGNVFLFDAANWDGALHFVPRGRPVIATIEIGDLIDDGEDIQKLTRRDAIDIPRVLSLQYFDIDGGLQADIQTSDRSLDSRSKSEAQSETTLLMRADDAARSVVVTHKVTIEEQRGEYAFSLPDSWCWLSVADTIMLDGERLRITSVEIDEGFQKYKCSFDRASAYISSVIGIPAAPQAEPPTLVVGDTVLQFIDSHILRDSDDCLGYYVAVSGTSPAWDGAVIELSLDGGANYIDRSSGSIRATMGSLTAPVGDHSRPVTSDLQNTVSVKLLRDDVDLQSTNLAGMMNRLNLALVGNEIINFAEADETSPGTWDLSNLLRGRKGSPVSAHPVGERFVMLQRNRLFFIDAEMFSLNRALTFRVTTNGGSAGIVSTHTFTGMSQAEQAPAYLTAHRVGSNIVIAWQGIGRVGGGANVAMGTFFKGFQVTINGVTQTTIARTLTIPDPGGSVIISVAQINQLTGTGPATALTL